MVAAAAAIQDGVPTEPQEAAMQLSAATIEGPTADVVLREATSEDADTCGRIFYSAFEAIARRHNLPVEPSSPEFTRFMVGNMLAHGNFAALVAERAGAVLGSVFVDERASIVGYRPGDGRPGCSGPWHRPGTDGVGAAA
jgi:hypothetical protein